MALSSATKHPIHPEFGRKWRTGCLSTRFPSAYPAVCGIQREAKKKTPFFINIDITGNLYNTGTLYNTLAMSEYYE